MSRAAVLASLLVCLTAASGAAQAPAGDPPQPLFRTRVTMVPLDVRVVDAKGQPITDLKAEDFTILENGVPQPIRHFATSTLEPGPAYAATAAPAPASADPAAPRPQGRRVFLLMMGRGRMQGPSREMQGVLKFVRERLLPQDIVAVQAYNRATTFTADHAGIAKVLESYRERNARIEAMLAQYFSGLRAAYGSREIPDFIQKEIDAIFDVAPELRVRPTATGAPPDAARRAEDDRRTADDLQRAELLAARPEGMRGLPDPGAAATAAFAAMSFDEFVGRERELSQDVGNLYSAIAYMRHVDGEKQLVLMTPRGVSLPRKEDNDRLAVAAADARVALNMIYTGGTAGAPPPRFVMATGDRPGAIVMEPVPTFAQNFRQATMAADQRAMAAMTGGQASAFRYVEPALDRIDTATRFQYILGYYPSNPAWDGRFRNVAVRVARRGATVLVRRGYFATEPSAPLDRRAMLAQARIASAAFEPRDLAEVRVTLDPAQVTRQSGTWEVVVSGSFYVPHLPLDPATGRHPLSVTVVVYCADAKERLIGQVNRSIVMEVPPASMPAFDKEGARFDTQLTVKQRPAFVKVIVYDELGDLVGSATIKVR
jgi:VWFA-related protein